MPRSDRHSLFRRHDDHASPPSARWRRLFAWLSLFALLFNLAGAVTMPATAGTVDAGLHALCTAGGMVVAPQQDGGTASGMADDGVSCVFCLPLLHGGVVPAAAVQMAVPAPIHAVAFAAAPAVSQKLRRPSEPASPRAPPL